MSLRHSFAVNLLRAGITVRDLQERLGHGSIETTLEYQRAILPDGIVSPADKLTLTPPVTVAPIPTAALPLQAFEMPVACAEPPIAFAVAIKTRLTDRFLGERAPAGGVVRCSSP